MKISVMSWFAPLVIDGKAKRLVSISRSHPPGFKPDAHIEVFKPSQKLLSAYLNGNVDWDTFKERYIEEVTRHLDEGISQLKEGDVLCCWEGRDNPKCHRKVLAELLIAKGVEVNVC